MLLQSRLNWCRSFVQNAGQRGAFVAVVDELTGHELMLEQQAVLGLFIEVFVAACSALVADVDQYVGHAAHGAGDDDHTGAFAGLPAAPPPVHDTDYLLKGFNACQRTCRRISW